MHCFHIKSLEGGIIRPVMAKRLSKALRGKRRWLGLVFTSLFSDRLSFENHLRSVLEDASITPEIRLMEFYPSTSKKAKESHLSSKFLESHGYAVVEVRHPSYKRVREILGHEEAISLYDVRSFTSSGKIRLVRERMGLPLNTRRK